MLEVPDRMITRTVSQVAEICGATLEGDGAREVVGPAALDEASPAHVSFLGNPRYTPELARTRAAAVLVGRDTPCARTDLALLRCDNPNQAFSRVIEAFRPVEPPPAPGVHPTAAVAEGVHLGAEVSIGACCVVEAGAVIGDGAVLRGGVVVGAAAKVGAGSQLHPGVVLYPRVEVGARCILHAGCVVGSDGFGFDPTAEGWEKIPQCGTVIIEDEVELGANTTIDRGRFDATRIGRGAKLDNLVQVGHNVRIGPKSLVVAQTGIAGSSRLGERVILAGQVGVAGHIEIGDGARISAQSGVGKDTEGGQDYFGSPIRPQLEALRIQAALGKLPGLLRTVRRLEARIAELEGAG